MSSPVSASLNSLGLRQDTDGIWFATEQEAVSYPSEGNNQCFEIEDKSFWFQHRNACIVELVKNFPPRGNGPISDVGGGNGFVAKGLMDAGWDVMLVEPGPAGARNAKKRGLQHVICATTQAAGFKPGSMPAIGVFDVVEHIEDDVAFLRHLHHLLEPGGMLYLTVPAYNFLWSEADVSAGHYRRYTLRALEETLQAAGLQVTFGTYIFRVLPLTVFLFRSLPFRFGLRSAAAEPENAKRTHGTNEGILVQTMRRMLAPEANSIARAERMAFGGSCLVAARKPVSKN
jgi:2-polyprenyl-3-methyl-5-hydroxy-6-metoxy-1,4-benzoquinol methylase